MNYETINYPLELNRREKRLQFFRKKLGEGLESSTEIEDISHLLDKYSLLLAKLYNLASAKRSSANTDINPAEQETWAQLLDLERQLNNYFANYRLFTTAAEIL